MTPHHHHCNQLTWINTAHRRTSSSLPSPFLPFHFRCLNEFEFVEMVLFMHLLLLFLLMDVFNFFFSCYRLQALEAFIHTQRQLLERQRSDIDKLHRLRVDLCARPAQVLGNLSNEVSFFFCLFWVSFLACPFRFVSPLSIALFFSCLSIAFPFFTFSLSPIHERTKERTAKL